MEILWPFVLLPLALGLLGFVEPCSIGASLLFLKSVEGNPPATKLMQAGVFTLTRALFIGNLGAIAALIGAAFIVFQQFAYILLGSLYLFLGIVYLTRNAARVMRSIGPGLRSLSTVRGSAALAMLFGLNVPACAAPLLAAVLGSAAVAGAAKIGQGFLMLALFGLGLSLPIIVAMAFGPAQRALEWLGRHSGRLPIFTGSVLVLLGASSIWFGLAAPWARG